MTHSPTRREFLASAAAVAVTSRTLPAGRKDPRRTLIDPCNLTPLPGVRLRIRNLDSKKSYSLRTDSDGTWDMGLLIADVADPAGERFRIRIKPQNIGGYDYAGLDYRAVLKPGIEANARIGRLALIPLAGAGRDLGIDDAAFETAWPEMLRDVLFTRENTPDSIPKGAARGAVTRFERKKIILRLGASLDTAEADFVRDIVENNALRDLTAGEMRLSLVVDLPTSDEPFYADELPPGTITVVKRDNYPKPVVSLRFSKKNPHEIVAAGIVLDDMTLNSFYRGGAGSEEEIAYARHIVQRCLAEALGYRPTARLPNRTLLDANFDPPGGVRRTGIRPEDILLARVLYGALWLAPGSRWSPGGKLAIMTDYQFPKGINSV
ncbi:MAG TPA: hypothetical protein VMX35_08500 [Acidobacteriota bacterium]|nr:hypothetical protein [Acidobacteriota bacterium]